ncbi:nucleoside monophosphate kinase, partial [candidate division WWE3 bacterium]|nr:nucleoside monophosphate kinase [candidate division WWE3 bacterium]
MEEQFPIFKTKIDGLTQDFDLNSPAGRHEYFHAKAGDKIEALKQYLDSDSFVSFWLAKKGAGKGTYSKMFAEIIGEERVAHIAVGDIVRDVHAAIDDDEKKRELINYLHDHYRGPISVDEAIDALLGRSVTSLLPTEFILTLIRREIEQLDGQCILMDGFPRGLDQVSYSLYFREIMNLRHDPDFFVLIDVPNDVIDARYKARVVCPQCQLSRNIKFLVTKFVEYDDSTDMYYLLCDNPACDGHGTQRMGPKEGQELGIEAIRDRIETDESLISYALRLRGVPLIKLRNTVPVSKAQD